MVKWMNLSPQTAAVSPICLELSYGGDSSSNSFLRGRLKLNNRQAPPFSCAAHSSLQQKARLLLLFHNAEIILSDFTLGYVAHAG
jgi:hypothetical protein